MFSVYMGFVNMVLYTVDDYTVKDVFYCSEKKNICYYCGKEEWNCTLAMHCFPLDTNLDIIHPFLDYIQST